MNNLYTLTILALLPIWTSAWLHWLFKGEIRHFLFAYVFPRSWRAGRERSDVLAMHRDEFEMFLSAESAAPAFVRGVLSCPACASAYIAAFGTVLAIAGFFFPIFLVPLIWASTAWVGHRLFHHL